MRISGKEFKKKTGPGPARPTGNPHYLLSEPVRIPGSYRKKIDSAAENFKKERVANSGFRKKNDPAAEYFEKSSITQLKISKKDRVTI